MDYSVLESIGVGWDDSVLAANEKRTSEYERQAQAALEYAACAYMEEWTQRIPAGARDSEEWVFQNRLAYQRSFEVQVEGQTQLAVSIPIDAPLRDLFVQARDDIIGTLCRLAGSEPSEAEDIRSSPVWIPAFASIPPRDLHITVCIPSLWRVPEEDPAAHAAYNQAVADALASASAEHECFVVEVDRLTLSKDGSLLVLFRTVGAQTVVAQRPSGHVQYPRDQGLNGAEAMLCDRCSEATDPMTSLRADVLYVFLERRLAHCQRSPPAATAVGGGQEGEATSGGVAAPHIARQATIVKTVGGSAHGFIHCSLSRFAISPQLTLRELDLSEVLRVCRSWSARLAGRRMAVRGFKLSEMTGIGAGGNKNPFDLAVWEQSILLGAGGASLSPSGQRRARPGAALACGACLPWPARR